MENVQTIELMSRVEELSRLRRELRILLERAELNELACDDMVLAVDEAVTNAIEHGYGNETGRIEVEVENLPNRIRVAVRDFAAPFDPTTVPEPELPPTTIGGLGLHVMQSSVDKLEYKVGASGGNILLLTKNK